MLGRIDFFADSGSENSDLNPEICVYSPARDGQWAETGQLASMGLLTSKGQKKWMEPEQESLARRQQLQKENGVLLLLGRVPLSVSTICAF